VDETLTKPVPVHIASVDDMLTMAVGTHCRAAQPILSNRFLQANLVGLFLSRWVYTSNPEGCSCGSF